MHNLNVDLVNESTGSLKVSEETGNKSILRRRFNPRAVLAVSEPEDRTAARFDRVDIGPGVLKRGHRITFVRQHQPRTALFRMGFAVSMVGIRHELRKAECPARTVPITIRPLVEVLQKSRTAQEHPRLKCL